MLTTAGHGARLSFGQLKSASYLPCTIRNISWILTRPRGTRRDGAEKDLIGFMTKPKTKSKRGKNKLKGDREPQPQYTHFLCLPLLTPASTPQLKASLEHFWRSIPEPIVSKPVQDDKGNTFLIDHPRPLFPDTALRPLGTLHLTLGVMDLSDDSNFQRGKLQRAKELLSSLPLSEYLQAATAARISEGGDENITSILHRVEADNHKTASPLNPTNTKFLVPPLRISLEGLFDFPPSPHRSQPEHDQHLKKLTRLLARPVDPTERLLAFATAVRQQFINAGFMAYPERSRELRLHATVVNTVYARKGGRNAEGKNRFRFDGREVVEMFEESRGRRKTEGQGPGEEEEETGKGRFVWASDIEMNRVQICEMGAKKVEGGGEGKADLGLGQEYTVCAEKTVFQEDEGTS